VARKKNAKKRPATAERRYEVRAELANFALAKAKSALATVPNASVPTTSHRDG